MSIATEISRLQTAKNNIKTQLENKKVSVPNNVLISAYDTYVSKIKLKSQEKKGINYMDYDGTVLESYTPDEYYNLTTEPQIILPEHENLTFQGWNWSFNEVKEYLSHFSQNDRKYVSVNIGSCYVTTDGATKIYVELTEDILDIKLSFQVDGAVTVDWGDNSTPNILNGELGVALSPSHIYSNIGKYCISISSENPLVIETDESSTYCQLISKSDIDDVGQDSIYKIETGSNLHSFGVKALYRCSLLETISINTSLTEWNDKALGYCSNLKYITIPKTTQGLNYQCFNWCVGLKDISLNSDLEYIGDYGLAGLTLMKEITIPTSCINIGDSSDYNTSALYNSEFLQKIIFDTSVQSIVMCKNCFASNTHLNKILLPNSLTEITMTMFNNCHKLLYIKIPSSVTKIETKSFAACKLLLTIDCTNLTSVPTLVNVDAFSQVNEDCKIVVPDNIYPQWIATTNWSDISSMIVKESEV